MSAHDHEHHHEKNSRWVTLLAAVTMVLEIGAGHWTNSMALLADGWHMASHVLAIGLTWLTYVLARRYANVTQISFSKKKLFALTGFTSALALGVIGIVMAVQAAGRLLAPVKIDFGDALLVAVIGLAVNGISAYFLHQDHPHHDHNIRAAYLHVLADGLTSITAIVALLAGMYYDLYFLDSISGILSAVIIGKWSLDLIRNSGKELIDFRRKS